MIRGHYALRGGAAQRAGQRRARTPFRGRVKPARGFVRDARNRHTFEKERE